MRREIGSVRTLQFGAHLAKVNNATEKEKGMKMLLPFMVRLGAVVVSRCDVCFLSNSHFSYEWFTYVTNAAQVNPIWEKTSIFSAIIRQKVFIQGDWGEHERGEMQKTAFTNFTGQWRLNTWWIHIERSYSTGNCTPQIQKIMQFKWQRQQFLLLRNGKKDPKRRQRKLFGLGEN